MTRIPLASREQFGPEDHAVFDRLDRIPGPPIAIYQAFALAPNIANALLDVSDEIRNSRDLAPEMRELITLHVVQLIGATYQYGRHWNTAQRIGISKEKILAVPDFATSPLFTSAERAALQVATELTNLPLEVDDASWDALCAEFNTRAVTEILMIIGWYHFAARFTGALKLDLEDTYVKL